MTTICQAPDVLVVFVAKTARTFCYGFLGVLFPLYLSDLGVTTAGVGTAVTLTLVGSAALTWAIRRPAERYGPRPVLVGLGALSGMAALLMLAAADPRLVVLAAMLGNLAVGTGETGPFLTLEQVLIARAVDAARRTTLLSAYNLAGYAAAAFGAALAGVLPPRHLFLIFLAGAGVQCLAYACLAGGGPLATPHTAGPRPPSAPPLPPPRAPFRAHVVPGR